mgnify:CR=1 FL=1
MGRLSGSIEQFLNEAAGQYASEDARAIHEDWNSRLPQSK